MKVCDTVRRALDAVRIMSKSLAINPSYLKEKY